MDDLGPSEDDVATQLLPQEKDGNDMESKRLALDEVRIFILRARAAQEMERFQEMQDASNRCLNLDELRFQIEKE